MEPHRQKKKMASYICLQFSDNRGLYMGVVKKNETPK